MRNLRLLIAYHGAGYSGWQVQPDRPTVQGTIEATLQRMTQQPCRLRAAGRTDAGVHAEGQVANFRTTSTISCERFRRGLDALLPPDIRVRDVAEADTGFDARRDNHGKHYRYTFFTDCQLALGWHGRAWHQFRRLDLPTMARAAWQLVGTHDFAAFRAADCERQTTERVIYRCSLSEDGPLLLLDVEGTAFLKNMVRIIAGTLLQIGSGQLAPDTIPRLLASGDRTAGGVTAPAQGLCLRQVLLR